MFRDPGQADPVGVDVVPGGQAGQHHAAAVIREQITIPVLIHMLHRCVTKTLADLKISVLNYKQVLIPPMVMSSSCQKTSEILTLNLN